MPKTPPPLDFDHKPGFEIRTKHKEAIRQLHGFGGKSVEELMERYSLSRTTIIQVLGYPVPERTRPTRTGRPQELSNARVDEIIEYLSDSWENRTLNWTHLRDELKLSYTPETLATRLKQKGYYRYTACQKPYLTTA
jgi:transposase